MSLSRLLDWHKIQCSFCSGRKCKHEDVSLMVDEPAISGLNSTYITERMIASQRPSTRLIKEYGIIQDFIQKNITAIFNLQESGEHPNCGDCQLENSGFSYDPEEFMRNNIRYYSFAWRDLSTPKHPQYVVNIMHVMESEMRSNSGGSVMIHCHAGLGRTGLIIACYLLYSQTCKSPKAAIKLVRERRPGTIQTKNQVLFVKEFYKHLCQIRQLFTIDVIRLNATLGDFMKRQHMYLHGLEYRKYKRIPKLIYVICERFCKVLSSERITPDYHDWETTLHSSSSTYDFSRRRYSDNTVENTIDVETSMRILLRNMKRLYGAHECDAHSNLSELHHRVDVIKRSINNDDWSYIENRCNDLLLLIALWIDFIRQMSHEIIPFSFIEMILQTYDSNTNTDAVPSVESLARRYLSSYSIDIFICIVHWMAYMCNAINIAVNSQISLNPWEDSPLFKLTSEIAGIVLLAHCTSRNKTPSKLVKDQHKRTDISILHVMLQRACKYCIAYNESTIKAKEEQGFMKADDSDDEEGMEMDEDYQELIPDEDQVALACEGGIELYPLPDILQYHPKPSSHSTMKPSSTDDNTIEFIPPSTPIIAPNESDEESDLVKFQ